MKINSLKNKVIIVTGGAGTIGRIFSRVIAENGGIAIAADINEILIKSIKENLESSYPGKIIGTLLDITDKNSIVSLVSNLKKSYGHIDALINSAYPRNNSYGRHLEEVTYVDFSENISMHLGGYFLVTQQLCFLFKDQGYGNVINISSIYGSMTPRFSIYEETSMTMPVEYAAIKSGIEHLTRYFAQYYKGTGIRFNSLSPGGLLAGQPANFVSSYKKHCASKGLLDGEDLVGALTFLLSDESKYINGQNLIVDDGFSL